MIALRRPAFALQNPALILVNRMKVEGFIVSEHMEVWPEALKELGTWSHRQAAPARDGGNGHCGRTRSIPGPAQGQELGKQLVKGSEHGMDSGPRCAHLRWTGRASTTGRARIARRPGLRCNVASSEQGPYQDPDGADKRSHHLLGYDEGGVLQACMRVETLA